MKRNVKSKKIVILSIFIFVLSSVGLFWTYTGSISLNPNVPDNVARIGNMNGVKLNISSTYAEAFMEYENESVWQYNPNPPVRTYDSKIDSFPLAAKLPNFEHRYQNNNLESYMTRDKPGGSRDWIHISIQSLLENTSPEQEIAIKNSVREHGLYRYIFFVSKLNGFTSKQDRYVEGYDSNLGLKNIKPTGEHVNETYKDNDIYYWDGIADIYSPRDNRDEQYGSILNAGYLNTLIKCPGGIFKKNISPECTQDFLIPELMARVTVYYKREQLPHWKKIQEQSKRLILSFTQ